MRLIDADAFKQYCSEGLEEMRSLFKTDKGAELAVKVTESFLKDIDEQPTVEAQPIHGSTYGGVSWGGTYREEAQPCEDCISREAVLQYFMPNEAIHKVIEALPSVKPQYTDEEIDKAQAVEQAYVDKMVELAVKETERPKGKWIKIEYDVCTFIYKCSKCGMRVVNPYKYCPNCGSDNGGEEDG